MSKHALGPTEPFVYLKAFSLGIVLWQILLSGSLAGSQIYRDVFSSFQLSQTLVICLVAGLVQVTFFHSRNGLADATRIAKSLRVDLLLLLSLGLYAGHLLSETTEGFLAVFLETLGTPWLLLFSGGVVLAPLAYLIRRYIWGQKTIEKSTLLSDQEIKSEEEDILDVAPRAADFAAHVSAGNGSTIFGIDAPWGTGKSSFVNLCSKHWALSNHIVYRFEPLRYAEDENLIERFLTGLISEIQRHSFVPELRPTLTRYSRAVKGKAEIGLGFAKLDLESGLETVDDMLEDLTFALARVPAKVIVVVDDLDRIDATTAKKVMFAMKKTFNLPNVNYIFCYDTEILSTENGLSNDSATAREFLEKFVTVKIGLFIGSQRLMRYMRGELQSALKGKLSLSTEVVFTLNGVVSSFADLYGQHEGWRYRKLLGDIRKVKRLVNLLLMLRLGEVQFDVQDFDSTDLLHLLLLYLTYPGTFREIYASEIDEQQGIFALARNYKNGSYSYSNHPDFETFLGRCETDEKFLLNRLFHASEVDPQRTRGKGSEEQHFRTRACHNNGAHRNLARYLQLIVDLNSPEPSSSLAYYIRYFNSFKAGAPLSEVIRKLDQSSEKPIDEFWRVLASRADELHINLVSEALNTLLSDLPHYSFVESPDLGIGVRDTCVLTLLRILDSAAWIDERSERRNNSDENVSKIADWIFGDPERDLKGIIYRLSEESRGLLGIFDLLLFRLYCHPSRGSLFNVGKALIRRSDPKAPTSGVLTELDRIASRKLSQAIFAIFDRTYIQRKRNIFEDAFALSVNELAGRFASRVRAALESDSNGPLSVQVQRARRRVLEFSIYQLTNRFLQGGVGCGLYDFEGAGDGGEIAKAMNSYVFDFCFNPELAQDNVYWFADYMISDLERGDFGSDLVPTVSGLVRGFDKEQLISYWRKHRERLLPLAKEDRVVFSSNYSTTYKEHLPATFKLLDEIAQDGHTEAA